MIQIESFVLALGLFVAANPVFAQDRSLDQAVTAPKVQPSSPAPKPAPAAARCRKGNMGQTHTQSAVQLLASHVPVDVYDGISCLEQQRDASQGDRVLPLLLQKNSDLVRKGAFRYLTRTAKYSPEKIRDTLGQLLKSKDVNAKRDAAEFFAQMAEASDCAAFKALAAAVDSQPAQNLGARRALELMAEYRTPWVESKMAALKASSPSWPGLSSLADARKKNRFQKAPPCELGAPKVEQRPHP